VGVEPDEFARADGQTLRRRYGWGDAPVVAFVGQFTSRKGLPLLLSAMPAVWERYPETRLLLAGASGSYSGQLARELIQLAGPDAGRVAIINDFAEEDKANIFSACDIFVLPSVEESFGIVFLEAWACRKPVVGMRAGAIPSVISEGRDGLLVKPGDVVELARAICDLLSRPEQRTELGQAGYQKVMQNYTWDIVTDKFRQVYVALSEHHNKEGISLTEPINCG
jgi:glycosyltransferase involved in cell wall biosynthesis